MKRRKKKMASFRQYAAVAAQRGFYLRNEAKAKKRSLPVPIDTCMQLFSRSKNLFLGEVHMSFHLCFCANSKNSIFLTGGFKVNSKMRNFARSVFCSQSFSSNWEREFTNRLYSFAFFGTLYCQSCTAQRVSPADLICIHEK